MSTKTPTKIHGRDLSIDIAVTILAASIIITKYHLIQDHPLSGAVEWVIPYSLGYLARCFAVWVSRKVGAMP